MAEDLEFSLLALDGLGSWFIMSEDDDCLTLGFLFEEWSWLKLVCMWVGHGAGFSVDGGEISVNY